MNKTTKIALIAGVTMVSLTAGFLLYRKFFKRSLKTSVKDVYDNLLFDFGKSTIKEISFPYLDELALALNENPEYFIEIVGHTDDRGDSDVNLKLSQNRADAVRKYLISKGVNSERITAVGKGEDEPIADNETEEGRAKNRRVEFILRK